MFSHARFNWQSPRTISITGYMSVLLIFTQPLRAAFELFPSSTLNLASGNLRLSGTVNMIDLFSDPAGLANLGTLRSDIVWGRQFQLKELDHASWAIGFPLMGVGVGLGGSTFGNFLYQETIASLMLGKTVLTRLDFGLNLMLYRLTIKNYGEASAVGVSLSWHYRFKQNWTWVTSVRNLNAPVIGQDKEQLPQVITTGVMVRFPDKTRAQIEWEHDIEYEGRLKFGITYSPIQWIGFSGGYASSPGQATLGFFMNVNKVTLEYAVVTHSQLNQLTQQLGLGVNLDRR